MTPKQLLARFGGQRGAQARAARALGYTPQRVGQWVAAGRIPPRALTIIKAKLRKD